MKPLRVNKWHRDILGNPRSETRQTSFEQRFHSRGSLFDEVPAIQPRQRVNVDDELYYRYGNGVSLFLRRGGRERDHWIGENSKSGNERKLDGELIRVVYEIRVTILFISLSSTCLEENSWSRSNLS